MMGWREAWQAIAGLPLDSVRPQTVPLQAGAGRVLAEPVPFRGTSGYPQGTLLGHAHLVALARIGVDRIQARALPQVGAVASSGSAGAVALFSAWARRLGVLVAPAGLLEGENVDWVRMGRNLDLLARLGAWRRHADWEPLFDGVDMSPGGSCALWRGPAGLLVVDLPGDPEEALVAFHVLVVPLLRRLRGEAEAPSARQALLRFSKVQVSEQNLWHPGRFLSDPGGAAVEHSTWDAAGLGRADCLFHVSAGQWLRDGDLVVWVPLASRP